MESKSESLQLQIRFVTKQELYSVADTPFAVEANTSTNDLNSLVNALLKESGVSNKTINFDFLAAGEFIRTTLGEHLTEKGVSSEDIVPVEYIERLPAPQPKDCLLHDDWVSAVQGSNQWILTGCYDNTLHIWTTKGKHKLTIPGHTASVKAVAWLSESPSKTTFVSGSHDQTAMIWEWYGEQNIVECVHVCKGHSKGIECIGVSPDKTKFATGSWDTLLKIWSADVTLSGDESEGPGESKRIKIDKQQIRTPLVTLKGHRDAVSGLSWTTNVIATCSWDHTIRLWDPELACSVQEIAGNKSYFDLHVSPISSCILAASSDRHVRLYDPKSNEGSVVKSTFTSHTQWVQSVRWSLTNEFLFISGSYDNEVKMWDIRSPQAPLFDLSGHEDKVLCCDWSNPSLMMSGGTDNTVRIFKTKSYNTQ